MFHHNSGKSPSKQEQELVKFKGSFVYLKAFFGRVKELTTTKVNAHLTAQMQFSNLFNIKQEMVSIYQAQRLMTDTM